MKASLNFLVLFSFIFCDVSSVALAGRGGRSGGGAKKRANRSSMRPSVRVSNRGGSVSAKSDVNTTSSNVAVQPQAVAQPVVQPSVATVPVVVQAPSVQESSTKSNVSKRSGESERITKARENLVAKIDDVKNQCSGIASGLRSLYGFTGTAMAMGAFTTITSGASLAVQVVRDKKAKKEANVAQGETAGETTTVSGSTENTENDKGNTKDNGGGGDTNSSKNRITNLSSGAVVISGFATGTSAVSAVYSNKAKKSAASVAGDMSDCNFALKALKLAKSKFEMILDEEEVYDDDAQLSRAGTVLSACQSYDDGNIDTVKKMMNVSTGVAGVGTAVSLVGTATAVAGAVKSLRGQDDSKLNKVSKIATGATAATGATTGVISGIAHSKAKKDFDSAQRCESVLRNI